MNAIAYRTVEPVYYNKGTKYEKTCNEFLYTYCYNMSEKEVDAKIAELNARPNKEYNGKAIKEFFKINQEEMY